MGHRADFWYLQFPIRRIPLERRLDKDHEKTTNSAEAWIYWANCQRVLNQLQYNTIQNF